MTERNPLIENQTEETLINITAVLTFVQEFHESVEISSVDRMANVGLSLTLKCANEALSYEIDNINKLIVDSGKDTTFEA